jgi:hypothetical protein
VSDDGSAGAKAEPSKPEAAEVLQQLGVWAQEAADALDGAAEAAGLAEPVRKAPFASLGAALGVGYVLGGGLFSPTTGRLLRLGLKLGALPQVQGALLDVAEATLDAVLIRGRKPPPAP